MTVTFSDFPATWDGPNLLPLAFTPADEFGAVAAEDTATGYALASGSTAGPITSAVVTDGGHYVRTVYERLPPINISFQGSFYGTGATFGTPTLEQFTYAGESVWRITSIPITNGGSNYYNGEGLDFDRGTGGLGAGGGGGYASIEAVVLRTQPTLTAYVSSGYGAGAVFSVTLEKVTLTDTDQSDLSYWRVASVSVSGTMSGYVDGDSVEFLKANGDTRLSHAYGQINVTDGVIQSVSITQAGGYYRQGRGPIARLRIADGGRMYRISGTPSYVARPVSVSVVSDTGSGAVLAATVDTNASSATFGQVTAVTVTNGGSGYKEHNTTSTCCGQWWNGMSVVLKKAKQSDFPASSNAISVYDTCTYYHYMCGPGEYYSDVNHRVPPMGGVALYYNGPNSPPGLRLVGKDWFYYDNSSPVTLQECNAVFTAGSPVADCSSWVDEGGDPIVMTALFRPLSDVSYDGYNHPAVVGAKATITPGGTYDPHFHNIEGGNKNSQACFTPCFGNVKITGATVTLEGDGREWACFNQQWYNELNGDYELSAHLLYIYGYMELVVPRPSDGYPEFMYIRLGLSPANCASIENGYPRQDTATQWRAWLSVFKKDYGSLIDGPDIDVYFDALPLVDVCTMESATITVPAVSQRTVDDFPNCDFPNVTVTVTLHGETQ